MPMWVIDKTFFSGKGKSSKEEKKEKEDRIKILQGAAQRIPAEAFELIGTINDRYSRLDLDSGEFHGLSEQEKLALFVEQVKQDSEIARLNALSSIGPILVFKGIFDVIGGINLSIGDKGLYIYAWCDVSPGGLKIPVSQDNLKRLKQRFDLVLTCETLRGAIIDYSCREKYIEHVADYSKFFKIF